MCVFVVRRFDLFWTVEQCGRESISSYERNNYENIAWHQSAHCMTPRRIHTAHVFEVIKWTFCLNQIVCLTFELTRTARRTPTRKNKKASTKSVGDTDERNNNNKYNLRWEALKQAECRIEKTTEKHEKKERSVQIAIFGSDPTSERETVAGWRREKWGRGGWRKTVRLCGSTTSKQCFWHSVCIEFCDVNLIKIENNSIILRSISWHIKQ